MKQKIVLLCTMCAMFFITSLACAAPIGDIGLEYISGHLTSGPYGWDFKYDIAFQNQDLIIDIDIKLVNPGAGPFSGYNTQNNATGADASAALCDTWKTAIGDIWGNAFDIFDGTYRYDTVFNVDWVTSGEDFVVNTLKIPVTDPVSGAGRSNMLNWFTDSDHASLLAAHEFGHMMGLYDEYSGGATDPANFIRDSIMGNFYNDDSTFADQYDDFINWLSVKSSLTQLQLLTDTGDHYYATGSEVPEPATIVLFCMGLLGFAGLGRKS